MNILIAEPLAPAGIELFQAQPGWNVIVSNPKEYAKHLAEADALLVRSAVQVTPAVLEKAPKLRVIGRAGVGVDNVDLDAATAAGVLVMNTPGGNAISVAEHTLALMLAMARHIPQANASTRAGKWEKKKFLGNELRGKTLGIVGLGSIGREVVKRARAFEMRIVAHDPYVTSTIAQDLGVELAGLAGALRGQRLHHAARCVHAGDAGHAVARGVRADEDGRAHRELRARRTGGRSGAAGGALNPAKWRAPRWTFSAYEPPPAGFPLFAADAVLATPHIGGSTEEAQEIVGVRIAEQMVEYPARTAWPSTRSTCRRFRPSSIARWARTPTLAERLGNFAAHIATGNPHTVRLAYSGNIADGNTSLLRNAGLAGVLSRSTAHRANLVNAMQIAEQRGWEVVGDGTTSAAVHTDSIRWNWRRTAASPPWKARWCWASRG